MTNRWHSLRLALAAVAGVAILSGALGCGGNGDAGFSSNPSRSDAGDRGDAGEKKDSNTALSTNTATSITLTAPSAPLVCVNGLPETAKLVATVKYSDGSESTVTTAASWSSTAPQIGSVGEAGVFTAGGSIGGGVTVTVTFEGLTASARVNVSVLLSQIPAGTLPAVQAALEGATAADAAVVWAYPYDGTVWPRGLLAPILQWNGGAATDLYYVHFESAAFELEWITAATGAPASQIAVANDVWEQLTDSTSGATTVTVSRWDGTAATRIAKQTWTVGSGSMRGTIYYWSNDLGRVLRISPGAATADDFANQPPLTDTTQYQSAGCLMTCHSVSADGSTLLSGGGTFGGTYNLKTNQPIHSLGGTWGQTPNLAGQPEWMSVQWGMSALSPTGKYVLVSSMAQSLVSTTGGPATDMGLFLSADGTPVTASGVVGTPLGEPAWSPEGSRVAFVNSGNPTTWTTSWIDPPPGDLQVVPFDETKTPMFGSPTSVVAAGTGNGITFPTVSPDGNWVVYARAVSSDTRAGNGDLYLASTVTPNLEVRLASLDGDGYPFAAGARDLSWNFEPSFAPVAAGGYFWLVFTSRRTYGNILTGQALPCTTSPCTEVKQLWVAAIDQNPTPGKDPSHPPFHLTGQVETNLAMRGFWSLPPCKSDGGSCSTGTDCCGGYCAPASVAPLSREAGASDASATDAGPTAAGSCSSTSSGCALSGDKCGSASDCCGSGDGVTCINHVCSEPASK